jgi:hypothetical protein
MTKRVWSYAIAALLLGGAVAIWAARSGVQPLRSQHAQPEVTSMQETVFVSPQGNLFHAANCKDLHHPADAMSASEAIAKGYAPCTRCMRRALGK